MKNLDGVSKFLLDSLLDLQEYGATVNLVKKKKVYIKEENIYTSGFFDIDKGLPILTCAVGKDVSEWLPIYIHEYGHFIQWKKNLKVWSDSSYVDSDTFNKIIRNKPIKESEMIRILTDIQNLELDCEKRVVRLIKKYNLPINIPEYIKKANSYIFFYTHIRDYRSWCRPSRKPYENRELLSVVSSKFYRNYVHMPKKLKEIYNKHYTPVKKNNLYND